MFIYIYIYYRYKTKIVVYINSSTDIGNISRTILRAEEMNMTV